MSSIQFSPEHVQFIGHLLAQLKFNCTEQEDTILFLEKTFKFSSELLTQGFTSTENFNVQITNTQKSQKQQQKEAQKEALKLQKQQQKQELKLQKQPQQQLLNYTEQQQQLIHDTHNHELTLQPFNTPQHKNNKGRPKKNITITEQ